LRGLALAGFASVAAGAPAEVMRGLRLAAETVVAIFDLIATPEQPVDIVIEGHAYRLVMPAGHGNWRTEDWRKGFYAACAMRHREAYEKLVAVPRRVLLGTLASPTPHEVEQVDFVCGLQALARREPGASKLLARGYSESAIDANDRLGNVRLALRLHEGDPKRFNEALETALILHRKYYEEAPSQGSDIPRESPESFLALAPLGLACIAHDRGIPIEVESGYIPSWIVRHEGF
jgi:hypothetical protein